MGVGSLSSRSSSFLTAKIDSAISSAANTTSFLKPTQKDLVMLIPRIIARTGIFAFVTVPEQIDSLFGLRSGGSLIAEATGDGVRNLTSAALSSATKAQETTATVAGRAAGIEGSGKSSFSRSFNFQQVRKFGGVFTYMTSKWALTCLFFVSIRSHFNIGLLVHCRLFVTGTT